MNAQTINEAGKRYGRLLVLKYVSSHWNSKWLCQCDCGKRCVVPGCDLRTGSTRSCGCLRHRTKHGAVNTPAYKSWSNMIQRCTNTGLETYPYYGGRGISVCERWKRSFAAFLADMGQPGPGLTLDRINCDGNYDSTNCRWATRKEQSRNTRRNVILTLNGDSMGLSEWSDKTGISYAALQHRVRRGWTTERALNTPVQVRS